MLNILLVLLLVLQWLLLLFDHKFHLNSAAWKKNAQK